jgi:hypothetical protein
MMQSDDEDSVPAQEPTNVLGLERRKSEMHTMGGLLLILGAGAAHSALALSDGCCNLWNGRPRTSKGL